MAGVRAALGEEKFAAAWAAGQAMMLEQAMAEALADAPPACPVAETGYHAGIVPQEA